MYKTYKYLYYKLYKGFLVANGKSDKPEFTALLAVAMLFFINILSIYIIILSITDLQLLKSLFDYFIAKFINVPFSNKLLFFLPYLSFFYFTLYFKGKYKKIIEEFSHESKKHSRIGKTLVWLYVLLTILMFISALIIIYPNK